MIKLKITGQEMQGLSRFFQSAIGIAQAEIRGGFDFEVYRVEKNCAVNEVPWIQHSTKRALKVAERNTHIDEFQKAQRKLLLSYNSQFPKKAKTIQLTKAVCYFLLLYLARVEVIAREDYINFIAAKHSDTILKNLS